VNYKIITIPFDSNKEMFWDEELNKFTHNKRIKSQKVEFFKQNEKAYWSIFVEYEYLDDEKPIKEAENLTDAEKGLFNVLKDWRRKTAEGKGFPVYIICTNSQIEKMVKTQPKTLEDLKKINGFGEKKIKEYGKEIIEFIINYYKEENNTCL